MIENKRTENNQRTIVRYSHLAENIIIIDGQEGCGKTLFGLIVSAMDRVEILNYAFEIEFICRLYKLNKITLDAATTFVKMMSDHKLYQSMMGRETNFRYSDLSSVFNNPNAFKYFKRIFQEGDLVIPKRIENERPILSLTTHDLLTYAEPVFVGIQDRLTFVEIVRHPLYMLIQQTLNMERLYYGNARDIQIYFDFNGNQLPYFAYGWEKLFIESMPIEKTIYSMYNRVKETEEARQVFLKKFNIKIITIPFEKFVMDPFPYVEQISNTLNSKITTKTNKMLKKQNVPRKKVSDSIPLNIYKRCGWEPPQKNLTEKEELNKRRRWAIDNGANDTTMKLLDTMSGNYEQKYL